MIFACHRRAEQRGASPIGITGTRQVIDVEDRFHKRVSMMHGTRIILLTKRSLLAA